MSYDPYEDYGVDPDELDDDYAGCPACGELGGCDCTDEEIEAAEAEIALAIECLHDSTDWDEHDGVSRSQFADPGGESALRAATKDNPRIHPCPQCHEPNRLTRKDTQLHYVCDICAEQNERGF